MTPLARRNPLRITWRDAFATWLVGSAAGLYLAHIAGAHLPGLHGIRPIAAVVVALGLLACVTAAWPLEGASAGYGRWIGILATGVVVAAAVAVIGGSTVALTFLVGLTVALWLTTTSRHLIGPRRRISDRDLHDLIDREKIAR
ncbi:hypothetical protein AB0H43_03435 [Hamadaea sp. NPDC050747]|uniref:hypothetical protein n=1 Tax=Hamadaea sp. NPDC050747 TaxID=3155789 RepID=UPI0033D67D35